EEQATDHADDEARVAGFQRLDEGVGQGAVDVHCTPHQALGNAVDPHGNDVKNGTDGGEPEVRVDQADAVHLLAAEGLGQHVVDGTDGDHGKIGRASCRER